MRITVKKLIDSQEFLAAIHCDGNDKVFGTFEARGKTRESAIGSAFLKHKEYLMPSVEVEVLSDSW